MKKSMLFCFVIILLSGSLFGDQSVEIKKLEARVIELEKRVEKLEALLESSSKDEINFTDKWKNISQWRKLKTGMTMYQVKQILGEPPKINVSSYSIWYYYPDALGGNVKFDKSNNKLTEWSEP